ncbi:ribosomal protein S1 [Streptomyces sp. V4I23]|uniref:S1 RNA-binding domain-containing protein n=1 Tax=Streptomyces sp. V4I23 TaxID=3042282 RepID=UPI00278AC4EA|nr:S1 RNA-binding domain-containing protein [Streptomyces sp. V4I23]MDQ1012098.1 ribosomal protein S1 [Streptomyces sp. V4I23]
MTAEGGQRSGLSALTPGTVLRGVVESVFPTGAIIDLGGVHGLLSTANMSWRPFSSSDEIVRVGQELSVMVLGVGELSGDVTLSLKDLQDDPLRAYARDSFMEPVVGQVVKLGDMGAFVRVREDFDGLLPAAEFGEVRPEVGEEVAVAAVEVNVHTRRVLFVRAESLKE